MTSIFDPPTTLQLCGSDNVSAGYNHTELHWILFRNTTSACEPRHRSWHEVIATTTLQRNLGSNLGWIHCKPCDRSFALILRATQWGGLVLSRTARLTAWSRLAGGGQKRIALVYPSSRWRTSAYMMAQPRRVMHKKMGLATLKTLRRRYL